jgi:hypothetical protein
MALIIGGETVMVKTTQSHVWHGYMQRMDL